MLTPARKRLDFGRSGLEGDARLSAGPSTREDDETSFANMWTSETKSYALELLKSEPETFFSEIPFDTRGHLIRTVCGGSKNVEMVAFYANPRVPGYPMLSMEREMRTVMDNYNLLRDCVLVPSTTQQDIEQTITAYNPRVVCFSGHTTGEEFILSNGRLQFEDFANIIKGNNIDLVVLFACSTKNITPYFQASNDPVIIGWATLVEDEFAAKFSEALLKALKDHLKSGNLKRQIPAIYATAIASLDAAGMKDPKDNLNDIEQHMELFKKQVERVTATSPFTRQMSTWRQTPGLFDFRQPINGCTHCRPNNKGVPYIHAVSAPASAPAST